MIGLRLSLALAAAPLALLAAVAVPQAAQAFAGGPGGCTTCCNTCNLPTTHQVRVPGVQVTPPTVNTGSPTLGCDTCGFGGSGGGFGSINVTVNIQQSATATATSGASTSALSNAAAANLISSGGGGSGYWSGDGPSTSITNVVIEAPAPPPPPPRPVCVAQKSVIALYAVQAVCLDDKASPHPASQTGPDRDVADGYSGEIFRCVAGSHMQYTVAAYAGGAASFDRGQTKVCSKGDSLWRFPDGRMECRPQTPARDCNERSLLRRYGAGIKVVKVAGGQTCAAWSTTTEAAVQPQPQAQEPYASAFAGDGGVGRGW
ncbi:hypothetical protein BH09PSE2_BH09PSE2_16720 [soil metagenome]